MTTERTAPLSTSLMMALWFGIVAGLVEGAGLICFQKINWAQWGHLMHVSWEILWISPVVDVAFFVLLAILLTVVGLLLPKVPLAGSLVFLFSFLALYDWLSLTNRIHWVACLLLAAGVAAAVTRWFAAHRIQAWSFWRRTAPLTLVLFAVVAAAVQGGGWLRERRMLAKLPRPAAGTPNVLVIIVDTLRADHLSAYGYHLPTSPNIDRLGEEGVLFENAVAPCSYSLPSHVSLVTGRYQFEHGVGNVQPPPWFGDRNTMGGYPTLGEALQRQGYRTAAFSANRTYFTHELEGRGFIHFEDYFHSPGDMFVRTLYGRKFSARYLNRSDRSFFTRAFLWLGMGSLVDNDEEGSGSTGGAFGLRKRADTVSEELLQWIDAGPQRPFLAVLNYFDVHRAYGGPPDYPKPSWHHAGNIGEYDDSVKYVDDSIGRLLKQLERRGLTRNLLLIITSDHGESLGEHGLETHGRALYWDLIHVPLVFWYPGRIPGGKRIAVPVTISAIAATVMDLVAQRTSATFPGPPLDLLWQNQTAAATWPDPLSELAQDIYPTMEDEAAIQRIPTNVTGWMKTLVTPQRQLIVHEKSGNQLYDWTQDPGELHDLAQTPAGKAEADKLTAQLQSELTVRPPRPGSLTASHK
jgi:arylsulfatase A-like enzyme